MNLLNKLEKDMNQLVESLTKAMTEEIERTPEQGNPSPQECAVAIGSICRYVYAASMDKMLKKYHGKSYAQFIEDILKQEKDLMDRLEVDMKETIDRVVTSNIPVFKSEDLN